MGALSLLEKNSPASSRVFRKNSLAAAGDLNDHPARLAPGGWGVISPGAGVFRGPPDSRVFSGHLDELVPGLLKRQDYRTTVVQDQVFCIRLHDKNRTACAASGRDDRQAQGCRRPTGRDERVLLGQGIFLAVSRGDAPPPFIGDIRNIIRSLDSPSDSLIQVRHRGKVSAGPRERRRTDSDP